MIVKSIGLGELKKDRSARTSLQPKLYFKSSELINSKLAGGKVNSLGCDKNAKSVPFSPSLSVIAWLGNVEKHYSAAVEKLNPITPLLHNLFAAIPKAELHLHLSGSTPLSVIKDIMREEGKSEAEITKETTFNKNFHGLDDFLKTYYKVAWVVKTPEHFKKAAYQICMDAAKENVKYLEIRTSCIGKDGDPNLTLQAVTDGIKQAERELKIRGFNQTAKIIVLAQRHHSPSESFEHAKIAAKWAKMPGSLVVGFDIAGPESSAPVVFHENAIKYAQAAGLKVTIHAGETPDSVYKPTDKTVSIFGSVPVNLSGAQSIEYALKYGADRLGQAVHLYDNPALVRDVVNRQVPVESPPWTNVQLGNVDSYQAHPIKKMLDDGVLVSVATDNRTISSTNLTNEFEQLYSHNIITSWADIKKLILNGAKSAFLPEPERNKLVNDFQKDLMNMESKPEFKQVIDSYLTPYKQVVSFVGKKISQAFNNKAA